MKAYVFLGPSLPRDEAAQALDAIFLPPIQQGDLLRLLEREPRHDKLVVGIVDGYFETVPAVWHKEILLALSRGVCVFGAASMGALRAAELHTFGMVGVGTIFGWLRDGTIDADDEVAVQHGPEGLGYLPVSHALVDIRHGCAQALAAGVIGTDFAERIIATAQALPYAKRTHDTIIEVISAERDVSPEAIAAWRGFVATDWSSLKALDATAMLSAMRDALELPSQPEQSGFVLEGTVFLDRLRNEVALDEALTACGDVSVGELGSRLESLRRTVLLKLVAREAASAAGWEASPEELSEEVGRVCRRLDITSVEVLLDRMKDAGLDEVALWVHLRDELFVRRLMRRHLSEVDRQVAGQTRLQKMFIEE